MQKDILTCLKLQAKCTTNNHRVTPTFHCDVLVTHRYLHKD